MSTHPPIWSLVINAQIQNIQESIDNGANIDAKVFYNTDGVMRLMSSIHIAVILGYANIVKLLLENDADVSNPDDSGRTPLYYAVAHNEEACLELLLRYGSDANNEEYEGMPALHRAASLPNVNMVRMLIRYNANVLTRDHYGHLARDWAALVMDHEIYDILQDEEDRQLRSLAFAMAHHPRLGFESMVKALDPEVLRMVLDRV
jgi:ankyrin repeat protein